ncbi:hypothetical protein BUALT_Bualt11G0095000 [Buddleja alternifolia]|uniref:Glycosyl hydrolase family 32 C-terminal domain-containing protein n=1 Tax=Buddleja alternifolia TaxID=168488 RepID=A0AAV6X0W6_9LAMI|nr:hypothetical protein BUALT_Bualt11G0095000 [Buddleja alternifolia]
MEEPDSGRPPPLTVTPNRNQKKFNAPPSERTPPTVKMQPMITRICSRVLRRQITNDMTSQRRLRMHGKTTFATHGIEKKRDRYSTPAKVNQMTWIRTPNPTKRNPRKKTKIDIGNQPPARRKLVIDKQKPASNIVATEKIPPIRQGHTYPIINNSINPLFESGQSSKTMDLSEQSSHFGINRPPEPGDDMQQLCNSEDDLDDDSDEDSDEDDSISVELEESVDYHRQARDDSNPNEHMQIDVDLKGGTGAYRPSFGGFVDVDLTGKKLSLRSLIDHSVVESFGAGGKTCITSRVYPTLAIYDNALLYAFNNGIETVNIDSLKAWSMNRPEQMNQ